MPPTEEIEGGHELVLVVEDDELVRNYVVTQVRSLGYRTLSAANAEAFELAVAEVTATTTRLLDALPPRRQPPKTMPPLRRPEVVARIAATRSP